MISLVKSGTIVELINTKPVTYIVQVEGFPTFKVLHTQVSPRPKNILLVGTRLSIFDVNGTVKWASLEDELSSDSQSDPIIKDVIVTKIDTYSRVVNLKEDSGKIYHIRFAAGHSIWSRIHKQQKLQLEIKNEADGKTKFSLIPSPLDAIQQPTKDEAENTEKIGIDPNYFKEREKENHRYEIMRFLAEHLNDDLVEWYRMRQAKVAQFSIPEKPINPVVESAIKSMDGNFNQLYSHQARSLDSIKSGRNLIVVTQTASGKTLCYNPAIFENLITNSGTSKALYIFPLNALLMDQKEKVDGLIKGFKEQGILVNAELLKGGIQQDQRRGMDQKRYQILMLNPELLSVILNEPQHWQNLFSKLRYVVVDEVHTYRGILGLHMAGILRRLLLQARRLGSDPQFILSSATVSNPMDLGVRLTSLPESSFDLLTESDDGSFQAHKHWVVLNPDAHASGNGHDNHLLTAAMTMVDFLTARNAQGNHSPLNTILFAKSIREVNKAFKILQENLQRNSPHLSNKVRKYVSAELSANDKREIYEGLKSGRLLGVVSTNALEAGIDIGKLDVCIIAGFPFSVMRMRQMAGRVGRYQEGLVAFVPQSSSSIDQYYRVNPPLLLEQPPEVFVVDPSNPYIARKHINAAAYSMNGMTKQELSIFGANAAEIAEQAISDKVMTKNGSHFFGKRRDFNNKSDPYAIGSIRSQAQTPYVICKAPGSGCKLAANCMENNSKDKCEFQVTTLDRQYAYRDCHPGAIYEAPDGVVYRVADLDDKRRVAQVEPMPENTLDRTFVEEDVTISILGDIKAKKTLIAGAELQVGKVQIARSFSGYFTYVLEPWNSCRKCRKEYDSDVLSCPSCGKRTSRSYKQSKPKRVDFPKPHDEKGFKTTLDTVACWVKLPAAMEDQLYPASPCKLPGDQNMVTDFLKKPFQPERLAQNLHLSDEERETLSGYYQEAGNSLRQRKNSPHEIILYPGVYGQCLLGALRRKFPEGRSLEIFQAVTGYPVTDNLRHVCRQCQTSVLLQAMHTLEHTVEMRYPSVALGDSSDLGSYTRLGHSDTGTPIIFWYDNYDGGLGAAEKIFEKFQELLAASENTITSCSCKSLEGCPNCTHIGYCDSQNDGLSKPAVLALIALLQGKQLDIPFEPFVYRKAQKIKYEKDYNFNEYVEYDHGIGDEAPDAQQRVFDPYKILRIQMAVHDPVLQKAFEVRGVEIANEVPPVSAVELNQAYNQILQANRPAVWNIQPQSDPFKILEVLPSASLPMIEKIRRVIALHIHPDTHIGDKNKANEMMKLVNEAYDKARNEKLRGYQDMDND